LMIIFRFSSLHLQVDSVYIPVLIKKREQEKGLDRSKMVALSNYFFDTTQGHTQVNCCVAKNVYTEDAFDTSVNADFKGNFDIAKRRCCL
ncbi:hypothetical protein AA407_18940, partial [Vibrio anguillarum]|nr:hypothetical protein [Vibrio anguillarum]